MLQASGKPAALTAQANREAAPADGVVQIEITLTDREGKTVTGQDVPVTVSVEGGTLLGLDNGNPADHTLYTFPTRSTFRGRALAILRAGKEASALRASFTEEGLAAAEVNVSIQT